MISLPNIPTDNLYKFVFIAGVTLILSVVVFFTTQYIDVYNKSNIIKLEEIKFNIENDFLSKDFTELQSDINRLQIKLDKVDYL